MVSVLHAHPVGSHFRYGSEDMGSKWNRGCNSKDVAIPIPRRIVAKITPLSLWQ